ncbi:hypothetical protein NFI95_07965 [Acetobacteraceae bacterium KSS8]|uniref:Uncharacterized protein n=1 Tax=Endosaccharibacter trunci TaxID=2812733 RepID=A0ABT1W8E5_9PROT|nr:hypothetical protein [Acetobacteraceae bacterium KSS8]
MATIWLRLGLGALRVKVERHRTYRPEWIANGAKRGRITISGSVGGETDDLGPRPPRIIVWIVVISLTAMVLYWFFAATGGSSTANDATEQIFDVKQGRHPANCGAYVTWRQLGTIVILGLPALIRNNHCNGCGCDEDRGSSHAYRDHSDRRS